MSDKPLPHVPLWLLGSLTFSGTLAMHIFIPALPSAAGDLRAGIGAMQMTVSLYIVGLGVGQLVYGPLSDRCGRRPTLMVGLVLYVVAGLGAAVASHVGTLIAARLFQAFGGCAGLVLGRAILRDLAPPQEAARRLALLNLIVMLGPGLAPLVGSALTATLGWRSVLFALCALGIVNLVVAWRLLPETNPSTANPDIRALARHYRQLLASPAFVGYVVGGGCATTSIYAFIASAPFLFVHDLHRPVHEVGIYLAIMISGVWFGSMLASRLVARVAIEPLLVRANMASAFAAFALLALAVSPYATMPLVIAIMLAFSIGAGIASPMALTQAISQNPQVIGSASGLYGFGQMAVGAACTALAGLGDGSLVSAALVLAGAGVVSQVSFLVASIAKRRAGIT